MAHEIEVVNGVASHFYVGKTPWHGLGQALNAPPTVEEGIKLAGLDWKVLVKPLFLEDQRQAPANATVRETDNSILGVVGPKYRPLQNIDACRWFQSLLDTGEVSLHTAGSLQQGCKVWILSKINRPTIEIAEGDTVDRYILLSNSHDGTRAVRVGFTPIRVVCANTLSMAHNSSESKLIRCLHTRNLPNTLEQIREVMNTVNSEFEASAEQYRRLAKCKINMDDFRKYVRQVFEVPEGEKPSTRLGNILHGLETNFQSGRGNDLPSVKDTLWTAYNAVNEYLGYERGRSVDTRLDSLWFGEGKRIDQLALTVALAMAV